LLIYSALTILSKY